MSDSVRPHRQPLTRLLCPWDSPGKNTGVGCHFLLQCMKMKSESEVAQSCLILSNLMDCSLPGSSVHGIFQARGLEWGAIAFSNNKLTAYHLCLSLGYKLHEIKDFSFFLPQWFYSQHRDWCSAYSSFSVHGCWNNKWTISNDNIKIHTRKGFC